MKIYGEVIDLYGEPFCVLNGNKIDRITHYKNEKYEPKVRKAMQDLDFDQFIDVGALYGWYSVMWRNKRVVAYESNPVSWGILKWNTDPYPNIQCPYGALGPVGQTERPEGLSASEGTPLLKQEKASISPIDPNLKTLVKIDVEGNECGVIEELSEFLSNSNFMWYVEMHPFLGVDKNDVLSYFEGFDRTIVNSNKMFFT